MKKFKNYSQEYEKFFEGDKSYLKIEHVSLFKNKPSNLDEYEKLLYDSTVEMENVSFDFLIKMWWLLRRFCYRGSRRNSMYANGIPIDNAFVHFMRKYANIEYKIFFGRNSVFLKIATYAEDFFPNFDEGNPYNEKYEYPYKYMRFGHLALVHRMDERLDLLEYGEKKKMRYGEFIDYVVNYASCYNEEHGKKYGFIKPQSNLTPFDIRKVKNYEE